MQNQNSGIASVSLPEATKTWFRISLQTFGGPAGQIAVMQNKLVDEKKWISQERFLQALGYCMLLPGPEALQLSIYLGWLLNGVLGGIIAGVLFVLPGVIALLALSSLYLAAGTTALVTGLFLGLAPAVVAIVIQAVRKVAGRALFHPALIGIAIASFLALTLFNLPFPVVVLAAAGAGWLLRKRITPDAAGGADTGPTDPTETGFADADPTEAGFTEADPTEAGFTEADPIEARSVGAPSASKRPSLGTVAKLLLIGLPLWLAPIGIAAAAARGTSVFTDLGLFFARAALVTFGGAYAVLAYVASQATAVGWLAPGEMVHGLAMAETTPGPLITVVQFVGFVGAFRHPGSLNPWVAAFLASLLVAWVTFVPSFFFIFIGAPFAERLRNNRQLAAALAGITAAVVGIIANLAVFFALHNLFTQQVTHRFGPIQLTLPVLTSVNPVAIAIAAVASVLIFKFKWSTLKVIGVCVVLGMAAVLLLG